MKMHYHKKRVTAYYHCLTPITWYLSAFPAYADQSPACEFIPVALPKPRLYITRISFPGAMNHSPKMTKNIVHILP